MELRVEKLERKKIVPVKPLQVASREIVEISGSVSSGAETVVTEKAKVDPVASWVPGRGDWYCGYME